MIDKTYPKHALLCPGLYASNAAITYPSASYSFASGIAATTITPSNTGGAVPATISGEVIAFAGSVTAGYADGHGITASFNEPVEVATDAAGNVYVADEMNHKIRGIAPDGTVSTFAGSTRGYSYGQGYNALFNLP